MFNVLTVGDDPMVADLNRLFINRVADFHCCGVVTAISDAKAVLSRLAQVGLLLLSVHIQQENGLDLLPALRVDGRNIDIIMMTSTVDTPTLQMVLHYGMVSYLIKLFQLPHFEEALQVWHRKREVTQTRSCYAQANIDTLLRYGIPQQENARRPPKGLVPQAPRLVCQWVGNRQAHNLSTNRLAAALQISRVSCRKYPIWLEQISVLFTTNRYGITDRPGYRYRFVVEGLMLLTQYSQ